MSRFFGYCLLFLILLATFHSSGNAANRFAHAAHAAPSLIDDPLSSLAGPSPVPAGADICMDQPGIVMSGYCSGYAGVIGGPSIYALFASTSFAVRAGGQLWRHWHAATNAYWRQAYSDAIPVFDEFAAQTWTPQELMDYCHMTFEFHPDPMGGLLDNMQPPWAFLQRKRGDCEDWSNFMQCVLERQGKQAWLLFVFSPAGGHCVCFFRDGSTWSHISNRGLRSGFETWDQLITDVSRGWLMAYFVGPNQVLIPIWREQLPEPLD